MNCKRFLSLLLAVIMLALSVLSLTGCGEKAVMTLEMDGQTYTITKKELSFLFPFMKWNLFYNNGWTTATDTSDFWNYQYEDADGSTTDFDTSVTASFMEVAKTLLIEKYLYVKYGSPAIDAEQAQTYKDQLKQMLAYYGYGQEGYYKKFWGYTSEQELDYYMQLLRNAAIETYLFGDNGTMKTSDEEKAAYYTDNFVAYQFILLDMNNGVNVDEDGNKLRSTETVKNEDGTTTEKELDEYSTTELTDEEKEEKKILADTIAQKLKDGEDFAELSKTYSDNYYSVMYPSGLLFTKDYAAFNDTVYAAVKDFEIGDYTEEGISISNDDFVYFVKRVELVENPFDDELYSDFVSEVQSQIETEKFDEICGEYMDKIVVDEALASKYKVSKAFLSTFVNSAASSIG